MSRLKTLFALVLLTLWVPATAHCALEAAGWLGEADGCCAEAKVDCSADRCDQVENGFVKQAQPTLQVSAPLLATWFTVAEIPVVAVCEMVAGNSRPASAHPQDWVNCWHFEHRAALPARAPSPIAA